jgi:hypothetical protein
VMPRYDGTLMAQVSLQVFGASLQPIMTCRPSRQEDRRKEDDATS